MSNFAKGALAAAAMLAALSGAASASAAGFQSNGRTIAVHHGDLDLSRGADQRALRARIARAAAQLCVDGDLSAKMTCRRETIAHVDAPVVAAIARAGGQDVYADARMASIPEHVGN